MITVHLQNGQTLHFPDGTTHEIMRSAIAKNFPDEIAANQMQNTEDLVAKEANKIREGRIPDTQVAQPPQSQGQVALDRLHDAFRNIGAGGAESAYNVVSAFRPSMEQNKPDFSKMFGVQNKNQVIQKIPEMAASFIPGGFLAKGLSKAPGLVRALGTAAEQSAIQGGLGYLFNPEERQEAGLNAGGIAGGAQLGLSGLTSNNPIARAARYIAPRAVGGYAGEKGSELVGLPLPARIAAGIVGALGGGATAGILPKILGTRSPAAKNYAQDVIDAANAARPGELKVAQRAAERRGVHLTPGELTKDEVLLAKEAEAGKTKANLRLRKSLEDARKQNEVRLNQEFKSGVYSPAKHAQTEEAAFSVASPTRIPKGVIPKEHQELYDRARKFAKNNNEFSAELNKSRKGSIGEYDVIRRALDKMIKSEKGSTYNLRNARSSLSNAMKEFSDDYKTAMMYSERRTLVNEIESLADKKNLDGKTFFKFIEGDQALKEALLHTRDVPGAKQFLKDAQRIYSKRKNVDIDALAKKLTEANIPTSKSEVKSFIAKLFDGKSDKEVIKLMYDPDIMKKVHSIAGMNDAEKMVTEFAKVLGRKKAQDVARQNKEGK